MGCTVELRSSTQTYPDSLAPAVMGAMEAVARLNADQRPVMAARIRRRPDRTHDRTRTVRDLQAFRRGGTRITKSLNLER